MSAAGEIIATLLPFFGKDSEDAQSRIKRQSLHLTIIAGLLDQLHHLILKRDLVGWLERLARQPSIECRHRNAAWRQVGDFLDAFHDTISPSFAEIISDFYQSNCLREECNEVLTMLAELHKMTLTIKSSILTINRHHPLCRSCDLIHPLCFEYGIISIDQYRFDYDVQEDKEDKDDKDEDS